MTEICSLSYVGTDPTLFGADNALDKIKLNCAHEIGHQLGLSTLDTNTRGVRDENHDPGPFPTDSTKKKWFGLMKAGGGFEWLRSEDWKKANDAASKK